MVGSILRGIAAGAAGTTALNVVTYLDMVWRGRPPSNTPEQAVERISEDLGIPIPDGEDERSNRVAGLGALMGIGTGVIVGALYGLGRRCGNPSAPVAGVLLGVGAMAGSIAPMTAEGVTDPRRWDAEAWMRDSLPHLAYGVVTAATYAATEGAGRRGRTRRQLTESKRSKGWA